MTWQMWLVIGLFFWVFFALNWKIADPVIVGISIPTILAVVGILKPATAFSDFSNSTCMFFGKL